jgi:hypothetical protein
MVSAQSPLRITQLQVLGDFLGLSIRQLRVELAQ